MKKTILSLLFASAALMASDAASVYKPGLMLPANGAEIYKQVCAVCHGDNGKKIAFEGSIAIAGLEATKLAKELKDYRYGSVNKYGYGALMKSVLVDLSWDEVDAVAKHINGLK